MFKVKLQPTKDEAGAGERSRTRVRPRWSDAYLLYPISTRQTKVPDWKVSSFCRSRPPPPGLLPPGVSSKRNYSSKDSNISVFYSSSSRGASFTSSTVTIAQSKLFFPAETIEFVVAPPFILSSLFSHCWKRIRQWRVAVRSGILVTVSGLSHPPFSSSRLLYIYICISVYVQNSSTSPRIFAQIRPNRCIPTLG